MIYVWLSRFLYQATAGLPQRSATSEGCLRGLVSTERSLTPVDAGVMVWDRGEELTHTNETLLSVSGLYRPTKRKTCIREREIENVWVAPYGEHEWCLCVVLGVRVCVTFTSVCGDRRGVGFNSCYILWQLCDDAFRSVQKMWLTQCCSPQPQCQLHFLKPVLQLHATSLFYCHLFKPNDRILHHSIFAPKNNVNQHCAGENCDVVQSSGRNKAVQKSTHIFSNRSARNAQRRARDRHVQWIMNGYHCTTDALLFGVGQTSSILLILRKRLAGSFPVYRMKPL